jgi:hypothetical protein
MHWQDRSECFLNRILSASREAINLINIWNHKCFKNNLMRKWACKNVKFEIDRQ